MALGVKLLYPADVGYDAQARFINYNAKYLVVSQDDAAGTVTIRLRAASYDNFGEDTEALSTTYPVQQVQISNNPSFHAGYVLSLPYVEDTEYDVSGTTDVSNPSYTTSSITDDDASLDIVRITNWTLDAGEGPKTVYVRFVTAGGHTFPDPSGVFKGWQDDIIVVQNDPSLPKTLRVDNETDNHYVASDTIFSWQEAQDNISGLRGYNLDVILGGSKTLTEACDDTEHFDIVSRDNVNARIDEGEAVLRTRSSTGWSFSNVSGASKVKATKSGAVGTDTAHEIQWENPVERLDEDDVRNIEVHMRVRPEFPDSDGTLYAAIQTFDGLYSNAKATDAINATADVALSARSRTRSVDAAVDVELGALSWLYDLVGVTHVLSPAKTIPTSSFSLLDAAVDVTGLEYASDTLSVVERIDNVDWYYHFLQVSDLYEADSSDLHMNRDVPYYIQVRESPDDIHGFTFIDLRDSGHELGDDVNAIKIAANYASTYGELSEADLEKCHIRATLFTVTEGGGFYRSTSSSWGYSDTTFSGLDVAPGDPTTGSYDIKYTHEKDIGSDAWTPEVTYLTFSFPRIPSGYTYDAVKIEVWADSSLGHSLPDLRVPYCYAGQEINNAIFFPIDLDKFVAYRDVSQNPIYNADGTISGYDDDYYVDGTIDVSPFCSSGEVYYSTPLVQLGTVENLTASVNAVDGAIDVVSMNSPATHTIEGNAYVLQSQTSSTRNNINATANVVQTAGSGRDALSAAIDVSRSVTRSNFSLIDAAVVITDSNHQFDEINASVDVVADYSALHQIPGVVTVINGTNSVYGLPGTVFVSAPWNQDPIYVDVPATHTVINNLSNPWSDYALVEFNYDGSYAIVRPTYDASGILTGYNRTTLSTTSTLMEFDDIDQEIEVAYRENRYDVEETSYEGFSTENALSIDDASRAWGESAEILWQAFRTTPETDEINRLLIKVNNLDSGGDYFHIQAIIAPVGQGGLPSFSDRSDEPDPRDDIFGAVASSDNPFFRSCSWNYGTDGPPEVAADANVTISDPSIHRIWSEMVWIPSGTSTVALAKKGWTSSGVVSTAFLEGNTDYMIGLAIKRVDPGDPDTSIGFDSSSMDENFTYSRFRPNIRWKVLNVPIDSNVPERMMTARAVSQGEPTEWITEYKSTSSSSHSALMRLYDDGLNQTYSNFPDDLQDDAELIISYNVVSGTTVQRISESHTITPLNDTHQRFGLTGIRASSLGASDTLTAIYDQIRFSDRSVIPNIDLSSDIGITLESLNPDEEEVSVLTTQTEWDADDWGVNWSARYGAREGVNIDYSEGDLEFDVPPGDPDGELSSAEAHFLTPTQGNSFTTSVRMSLDAETLDTEFYIVVLPNQYEANVSDIEQTGPDTPQDFMIFGFRYNGDVYLYRPQESGNVVVEELISTLGMATPYDWGTADIKLRIANDVAGQTAVSIWHGAALRHTSEAHREFRPESSLGFWVAVGMRSMRDLTGALRLDVGNVKVRSVERNNPSVVISELFQENFSSVPSQFFVWPGVEEIVSGGSSIITGMVRRNTAEDYNVSHRIIAPTNVYGQRIDAVGVPDADTLDINGVADHSRMRLGVSIDDVSDIDQLTDLVRWIGPSLVSPYGVSGLTTSDAIRIDINYELNYPDLAGDSEVVFGIANWLPTNRSATRSNVVTAEGYATYSFTETDDDVFLVNGVPKRYNTRAQVNSLLYSGGTGMVGLEDEQYLVSKYHPSFALVSFASDDSAYAITGQHTDGSSPSPIPTTQSLGTSFLPDRGVISLIIKPQVTGGSGGDDADDDGPTVSISASSSTITEGQQVTITWEASNATSVVSSNFGANQTSGTFIDQPTSSRYYDITVQNDQGQTANTQTYVTVEIIDDELSVNIQADDTKVDPGQNVTLSWESSSNATSVATNLSSVPGIGSNDLSGSAIVSPTSNTTYTIVVKDVDNNTALDSVTIEIRVNVDVDLTADPASVIRGESTTLSWTSYNADYVEESNFDAGRYEVTGEKDVSPVNDKKYYIKVSDEYGNTSYAGKTIVVNDPPCTIDASVNKATGAVGDEIIVSYDGSYVTDLDLDISHGTSETSFYPIESHNDLPIPSGTYSFILSDVGFYEFVFKANYAGSESVYPTSDDTTVVVECTHYESGSHIVAQGSQQYESYSWNNYFYFRKIGSGNDLELSETVEDVLSDDEWTSYRKRFRIGQPVWLPPTGATISSASLILTANVGQSAMVAAGTFGMSALGVSGISGVRDFLWGVDDTVDIPDSIGSGETITFDVIEDVNQWANSDSFWYDDGLLIDIELNDPEDICEGTLYSITFASTYHPNDNWRPYYVINYTGVSGASLTARVPAASAGKSVTPGGPVPDSVTTMSTGVTAYGESDPQYTDIEIRVNDVHYVTAEGVPFNFEGPDGMRLVTAARRKTPGDSFHASATISKFSMSYVNIRALPNEEDAQSIALWTKTDGNVAANTLFYGRNIDVFQQEDDEASLFSEGTPVVAQRFSPSVSSLRAISVRTNSTGNGSMVAYICTCDTDDEPTITPGDDGHISVTDSNIIATAWGRYSPQTQEVFFLFHPKASLTIGNDYAVVFDYAASLYGTDDEGTLPQKTAFIWDGEDDVWTDTDLVCAFRTFEDVYINRENQHHARKLTGRVASTNNAGLTSQFTTPVTEVTADLIGPLAVGSTEDPPTLQIGASSESYVTNEGFIVTLRIGAQDTLATGSGVKKFRVVYETDFGEMKPTSYKTWNDANDDGYIDFSLYYEGLFLDTRRFYVQVQDAVGNISTTNNLYIDFVFAYTQDTTAPSLVRVRIEGDASIDPDPNEAEVTDEEDANVSLYVSDETTACKDFRINRNFAEDENGNLVYDAYDPYLSEFMDQLTGPDGTYAIGIQARDYGDNATQASYEHIERVTLSEQTSIKEIPTAIAPYAVTSSASSDLYIGTTRRTARTNLTGQNSNAVGYEAYTVYELWSGNAKQTFKENDDITVRVNGITVTNYTTDHENDRIIFDSGLTEEATVSIDIVNEIAVLYRYDRTQNRAVKIFDDEGERVISSLQAYDGLLYIGMDSGRIYTYNGIRTSASVYRATNATSTPVPVSCMNVAQFDVESQEYLYVGTAESAQVFRYGGNPASDTLGWNRLTTLVGHMTSDTDVFAIEMYEDHLWVATGPNGMVYGYSRTEDADGSIVEGVSSSQLYADEFTDDPSFEVDVLCLEAWNDKIYAGVDHNSSAFVYEVVTDKQPDDDEWSSESEFDFDFKNSPLPWEYYNNGTVDHNTNDRINFTQIRDDDTGELTDWYMTLDGQTDEHCCWIDRTDRTASQWSYVSNSTGWTMDFDMRLKDWGNDESYQGVTIYDGTYMAELRIYPSKIAVVSGDTTSSTTISIDPSEWHRYRLTVNEDDVVVYIDHDNTPVLRATGFLELETTGKTISIGKTADESGLCSADWRMFYYYTGGALAPLQETERDWTRAQIIPFGSEIRFLIGSDAGLIVGVQPRLPSAMTDYDDPATLVPRTYMREEGSGDVWQIDATYDDDVASIVAATLHDDHIWTAAEVSSDLENNTQIDKYDFITQDPVQPMLDAGNVYERRLTQSYDTILKDTQPPDASVIINEGISAGSVQVYAMEAYVDSTQHTDGFTATYSPLGAEVADANNVIDGDPDTYVSVGTSEARYVAHDFGGDGNTTLSIDEIKWGCRSTTKKTYRIEYLHPTTGDWTLVAEMISDKYGDETFYSYEFSEALNANGLRIYYTGDRETISNDVELSLSSMDAGIGTSGYKVSRYRDMRDVTGWSSMSDDTIRVNWSLMNDAQSWQSQHTTSRPITTGIVYDGYMVLASRNGYVYVSADGDTFTQSVTQFVDEITCFEEYRDVLYAGTAGGDLYQSESGVDWTLVYDTGQSTVSALAVFNDALYIGTGNDGRLITYDGSSFTNAKKFASSKISVMHTEGSGSSAILHIGLNPTGQIYRYDGSNYTQAANLVVNDINEIDVYGSELFAACDQGKLYRLVTADDGSSSWQMLIDTARRDITGVEDHSATGPTITRITNDGTGALGTGTYRYVVTWVDHAGNESVAGDSESFDNLSDVGRLKIEWQEIENARGYRIYRTPQPNQGEGLERRIDVEEITDTYFYDDGSYNVLSGNDTIDDGDGNEITEDDIAPPTTSETTLWFTGDADYVYTYDGNGMHQIDLPTAAKGCNGVISFRSQLYVIGQEREYTTTELAGVDDGTLDPAVTGTVFKWIGTSVGSGEKTVYAKFLDDAGNETNVETDTIFYNSLIENHIIEVDSSGTIVTEYESQSDPQAKLYSPRKMTEQVGIYESVPFYASSLSRWDVIEILAQLPYNTEVKLYARTGDTRSECLAADWSGPFTLENITPDLTYYDYINYEYISYYDATDYTDYLGGYYGNVDRGYYYEGEGVMETETADISALEGAWLQFKLELVTANKDDTPSVFYVVIRYQSTNAAMFYSTVFDLDEIANRERSQPSGREANRGIITYNGTIPDGGDIRFGISTANTETGDWSEYQTITPNRTFEIEEPGDVKVGIMLISTDDEVAIIDEWAMMLDLGDTGDVKINLGMYD